MIRLDEEKIRDAADKHPAFNMFVNVCVCLMLAFWYVGLPFLMLSLFCVAAGINANRWILLAASPVVFIINRAIGNWYRQLDTESVSDDDTN